MSVLSFAKKVTKSGLIFELELSRELAAKESMEFFVMDKLVKLDPGNSKTMLKSLPVSAAATLASVVVKFGSQVLYDEVADLYIPPEKVIASLVWEKERDGMSWMCKASFKPAIPDHVPVILRVGSAPSAVDHTMSFKRDASVEASVPATVEPVLTKVAVILYDNIEAASQNRCLCILPELVTSATPNRRGGWTLTVKEKASSTIFSSTERMSVSIWNDEGKVKAFDATNGQSVFDVPSVKATKAEFRFGEATAPISLPSLAHPDAPTFSIKWTPKADLQAINIDEPLACTLFITMDKSFRNLVRNKWKCSATVKHEGGTSFVVDGMFDQGEILKVNFPIQLSEVGSYKVSFAVDTQGYCASRNSVLTHPTPSNDITLVVPARMHLLLYVIGDSSLHSCTTNERRIEKSTQVFASDDDNVSVHRLLIPTSYLNKKDVDVTMHSSRGTQFFKARPASLVTIHPYAAQHDDVGMASAVYDALAYATNYAAEYNRAGSNWLGAAQNFAASVLNRSVISSSEYAPNILQSISSHNYVRGLLEFLSRQPDRPDQPDPLLTVNPLFLAYLLQGRMRIPEAVAFHVIEKVLQEGRNTTLDHHVLSGAVNCANSLCAEVLVKPQLLERLSNVLPQLLRACEHFSSERYVGQPAWEGVISMLVTIMDAGNPNAASFDQAALWKLVDSMAACMHFLGLSFPLAVLHVAYEEHSAGLDVFYVEQLCDRIKDRNAALHFIDQRKRLADQVAFLKDSTEKSLARLGKESMLMLFQASPASLQPVSLREQDACVRILNRLLYVAGDWFTGFIRSEFEEIVRSVAPSSLLPAVMLSTEDGLLYRTVLPKLQEKLIRFHILVPNIVADVSRLCDPSSGSIVMQNALATEFVLERLVEIFKIPGRNAFDSLQFLMSRLTAQADAIRLLCSVSLKDWKALVSKYGSNSPMPNQLKLVESIVSALQKECQRICNGCLDVSKDNMIYLSQRISTIESFYKYPLFANISAAGLAAGVQSASDIIAAADVRRESMRSYIDLTRSFLSASLEVEKELAKAVCSLCFHAFFNMPF